MKLLCKIISVISFQCLFQIISGQDTVKHEYEASKRESLYLKGQVSAWLNINPDIDLPVFSGVRYIPEIHYNINLNYNKLIDFEASVNSFGTAGLHPFDSIHFDGKIKPYRLWCRYSGDQYEIRLGLQKINFGSAYMLRPLMWFDQVDPRDPLQLTDGVWGLLGRYYFLNNANIWIWGLYGNKEPKTWETGKTNQKYPEFGGRFQMPVLKGESAISYHFRMADTRGIDNSVAPIAEIAENRIGLDGRWDIGPGVWFEAVWINKNKRVGNITNQEMVNAGIDYTFGIGNGLYAVFENLLASWDEDPFAFSEAVFFSGTSLSYPLGMMDNIGAIVYFDWKNRNIYSFANWKRQFDRFSFYLMAYINPKEYKIPLQGESGNYFSGKGIQLMLVYNH